MIATATRRGQLGLPLALAVCALGVVGLLLAAVGSDGPARSVAVLGFSLVGPGLVLNRSLRLDDTTAVLLAAPVSLALAAAGAWVAFSAGAWSPGLVYAGLLAGSLVVLAVDVIRRR